MKPDSQKPRTEQIGDIPFQHPITTHLPATLPAEDGGGFLFKWSYKKKDYSLKWGFKDDSDRERYLSVFYHFPQRISSNSHAYYVLNDPYRPAIIELGKTLLKLYGKEADPDFALFLLNFVQSIPYVKDSMSASPESQKNGGDWPMFPSEYFVNPGGDCEDSSIAYIALLTLFDYDTIFFTEKQHISVGVGVKTTGWNIKHNGKKYLLCETATDEGIGGATVRGKSERISGTAIPVSRCSLWWRPQAQFLTIFAGEKFSPICVYYHFTEVTKDAKYHMLVAVRPLQEESQNKDLCQATLLDTPATRQICLHRYHRNGYSPKDCFESSTQSDLEATDDFLNDQLYRQQSGEFAFDFYIVKNESLIVAEWKGALAFTRG